MFGLAPPIRHDTHATCMCMESRQIAAASIVALALTQLSPTLPPHLARANAAVPTPTGSSEALPIGPSPSDPVIFVVLDGVRWQEIFGGVDGRFATGTQAPLLDAAGLTPHLHAMMDRNGVALGAPGRGSISASGPRFVSLPAYREIFSGAWSLDCLDNDCPRIERPTLIDELRDHGKSAAIFSSWERIDGAAASRPDGVLISTGRDQTDRGVDPYPGDGGFRPDRMTARRALRHLGAAQPDFLFLGLGEPDEYAHRGDYAGYVESIRAADRVIGELISTLATMPGRGARTHVFVTTDHGRARSFRDHGGAHPESARVWLVAWGPTIHARGAIVTENGRRLADLAPTARNILGLLPARRSVTSGTPLYELFRKTPSP